MSSSGSRVSKARISKESTPAWRFLVQSLVALLCAYIGANVGHVPQVEKALGYQRTVPVMTPEQFNIFHGQVAEIGKAVSDLKAFYESDYKEEKSKLEGEKVTFTGPYPEKNDESK